MRTTKPKIVVICWKIRIFAYWTTPILNVTYRRICCDLLKNSYLCLLNNTTASVITCLSTVVICWKIRIFAYWTTPVSRPALLCRRLWFAEKFVSLLIEQHRSRASDASQPRCDLLKNSYLCLLNNTIPSRPRRTWPVVICWKIRIFAYWTTPFPPLNNTMKCCDLLKNSYLCLLNNTWPNM